MEQIRQLFEDNLVSPVFAVTTTVRDYYDILSDVMADSGAQAVTIEADSSDLIDAIQSAYEVCVCERTRERKNYFPPLFAGHCV